jgi:hypothetical protein
MQGRPNRKFTWSLLGMATVIAFLAFAYPMYVIRPFRAQGQTELILALLVKRWATPLAAVGVAIAGTCAVLLWGHSRRIWPRALILLASCATFLFAVLTRVNVYEIMFHRIDTPQSTAAKDAKLDKDDMVLAIHIDGHARAYPIRMMGYHHIVNDRIGATPIVATY